MALAFDERATPNLDGCGGDEVLGKERCSAGRSVGENERKVGLAAGLMPAVTEENLKPLGRKICPDSVISGVSPENSRARAESQTWATLPSPWQLHRNSDNGGRRSNPC